MSVRHAHVRLSHMAVHGSVQTCVRVEPTAGLSGTQSMPGAVSVNGMSFVSYLVDGVQVAPEPPIPAATYAPPGPWRGLKASVFKGRPKENDSKGFVNRPGGWGMGRVGCICITV